MLSNAVFITEEAVEKALDFLRDDADKIGQAKAEKVRTEHMVKHIVAIEMKQWLHLPVAAQKREAEASQRYLDAINEEAAAAGKYESLLALREAAALKIQVFQTLSANYRSMKI